MAVPRGRSRYRADIDGLRALAVIAVIFTHAGIRGFAGGFVGVDVFFVISGYLIHRDLLRRIGEGRFRWREFYGRRMRRTLPALFAMAAASLVAAWLVLMPSDLVAMARSLIGAVLLVPNLVFLTQTGYFDTTAATKPLLHTWSLGVEEQFYLVAPAFALLLTRCAARRTLFAGCCLASLAVAIFVQAAAPEAAFYLMPTRVFEFLIGAALAEPLVPPIRRPWLAQAITTASLVGLAASLALFSDALPHPGWPTLLPCVSTAAIIHVGATRRTAVGWLLGGRLPAAIGLVSYSLYLWHWPILVIARYAELPQSPAWLCGEAALLGVLAVASWRWIEQPFRLPDSPWRRRAPLLIPVVGMVLVASATVVIAFGGLPGRFPPAVASLASYADLRDSKPFREGQCFLTSHSGSATIDRGLCLALEPNEPNVLLIGDSHAAHLWTGLRDAWPKIHFLQATASGCKPVLGTSGAGRCTRLMGEMFNEFIPKHPLDAVILSALWQDADIAPLVRTLAALRAQGVHAIVMGPMPRYDQPVATLLARGLLYGDPEIAWRHLVPGTAALDARMQAAVTPSATYVSLRHLLCETVRCRLFVSAGVPIQFDYHHLTPAGSAALMRRVKTEDPALFAPQRSTSNR